MTDQLQLALLGQLEIRRDGVSVTGFRSVKAQSLLCYLAVTGRSHFRSPLAGLFWADMPDARARANLRRELSSLHRSFGEHLTITHREVAFNRGVPYWLDVELFESGATQLHDVGALREAVDLYRGDFLEGFYVRDAPDFEQWVLVQQTRLRELALQALHRLSVHYARQGEAGLAQGIAYTRRLLTLEPSREEAHRALMLLLAQSGQRGAALAQYEACRRALAEDLGVEPGLETRELYEQIRDGKLRRLEREQRDKRGEAPPPVPSSSSPPILPAFLTSQEEEGLKPAAVFVSRERELAQLDGFLEKALTGRGQIAFVIGEAGRGKTSLMHEFARRAQAAQPDLIVAIGICDDYTGAGDPYLPFRDVLKMLSGDVETKWAAGAISRDHALRLWHLSPRTAQALVEHGPDLIGSLIPAELLANRLAAFQSYRVEAGESSGWSDRLQELVRQETAPTGRQGPDQNRIFEAYTAVLEALAAGRPLLLLLDDLHWADLSSVGLMSYLGRRIGASPILIVGAYRPEDVAQGRPWSDAEHKGQHPLEMVLSELKRHFGDIWIDLDQAEPTRGRAFVEALLDLEPNRLKEDFRRELARHTEGQPLFTIELLQELQERGDLRRDPHGCWEPGPGLDWDVLPPRVEGVIEKRLGRLDAGLREALAVASVEGEVFTAEVVARVLDVDPRTLVGRLSGELVKGHRLLETQGMQRLGAQRLSRYRFRHNLFQKYLYSSLDEIERAHRHEAVGNVLQTLYGDQVDEIAVQLAWHFQEADIPELAVAHLHRAGERAMRLAANEEAVEHLLQGLAVLEALPESAEHRQQQLELQLTLGQAERNAGRIAQALETFQRSADIARELGSAEGLARAALGYEESRWRFNLPAEPSARLLADALHALGQEECVLRVRVWVNLVRTLMPSSSPGQFAAMSQQALEMARRVNDPLALYDALYLKLLGERRPENSAERIAAAEELFRLAPEVGERKIPPPSLFSLAENLELGDVQAVQADYEKSVRTWKKLRQPFFEYWHLSSEAMLTLLVGRFAEGERLAQQALDVGRQLGVENLDGIFGIQMFTIRREQRRLQELAPLVKIIVQRDSTSATWRLGLALLYSELGLRTEARAEFEVLAANGFADLPRDALWLTCIVYLAEVCAFLGDVDRATTLYRLLLPYAGRNVVVGFFTVCYGAAARYLGLLASTMSRWTEADGHFEAALKMNARLGARPWLAHTQYQYATMLLTRDQAGDRDRAMSLLEEALEIARELGMASLVEKVEALGHQKNQKGAKNASLSD